MRKIGLGIFCLFFVLFLSAITIGYSQEQRVNFVPSSLIIKSQVTNQSKGVFIDFSLTNNGIEIQRDDHRILPIVINIKKGNDIVSTKRLEKDMADLSMRRTQLTNVGIPFADFIAEQRYSIEIIVDPDRLISTDVNRATVFFNVAAQRIEVALEDAQLLRREITMADISNLAIAYSVVNRNQDSPVFDVGIFVYLQGLPRPLAMKKIHRIERGGRVSGKLDFSLANEPSVRPGMVNLSTKIRMLTPVDPNMQGINASGSNFGSPKSIPISFELKATESQVDLVIENLAIIAMPTLDNPTMGYRFHIRNIGNGEARDIGCRVDLLPSQEMGHESFDIPRIGPGDTVFHEGRLENLSLQVQGYYLRVRIDPSGRIPETKEDNNEKKIFFNVLN